MQQGKIHFTSPRKGGTDEGKTDFTTEVNSWDIVSWTNTQIQVKVPSRIYDQIAPTNSKAVQGAGTGPVKIVKPTNQYVISSTSLNIDYSILNVGTGASNDPVRRLNLVRTQCDADYTFTLHTSIKTYPDKASIESNIQAALTAWSNLLNIRLVLEKDNANNLVYTTSTTDATRNIIYFDTSLVPTTLMTTSTIYRNADVGSQPTSFRIKGDIRIAYNPGGTGYSWNYQTSGNVPINQHSFYQVFLHELGHILGLGHVNNIQYLPSDLMYYSSSPNSPIKTITGNASTGAQASVTASRNINWPAMVGIGKLGNTSNGSSYVTTSIPAITSNTGNFTLCNGAPITLSVSVQSPNTITSRLWSTGSTSSSISVSNVGEYSVRAVIGSPGCYKNAVPVTVTSKNLATPTITSNTGNFRICNGSPIILTTPAVSGVTYLWKKNGTNYATTQVITVSTVGQYTVQVSQNSCSITSNPVTIEALTPIITSNTGNFTIICNTPITLTTPAVSGGTYLWKRNGVNYANTQSITVSTNGQYMVEVTQNGCSSTSNPVTVTTAPAVDNITSSQTWTTNRTLCKNISVQSGATLTISASSTLFASTYTITVMNGGTIILSGGKIDDGNIVVQNGGGLTISNNGKLLLGNYDNLNVQLGAMFNLNYGEVSLK
jgi:hypothetical protein